MVIAALMLGLVICLLGLLGLAAPDLFVRTLAFFQVPPALYLAAAARIAIGILLLRISTRSGTTRALRILGAAVLIGGVLTPTIGKWAAHSILHQWAVGGTPLVRVWAVVAMAVGVVISYSVLPRRGVAR